MSASLRNHVGQPLDALAGVFRAPDVRRLGFAYALSLIALWAYSVAVAVYAFRIGGATLVGVAAVIRLAPAAVLAPFVAVIADRYPRRLVLLLTDLSRAALIGAAAAAVTLDASPALFFALAALVVVVDTAFEPAKSALLPELATEPEQLTASNVTMSSFESVSIFAGPALGGLLIAVSDVQAVFAVTAALLLGSALLLSRIEHRGAGRVAATGARDPGGIVAEAAAGFKAIGADRRLRLLVGLTGAQLAVYGALSVLVVAAAIELLEMGEAGVGYLDSAVGIGGLLGAVVALSLAGRRSLGTLLAVGLIAWGTPIVVIGLVPQAGLALALMGVVGVANTIVDSAADTLLQRCAPAEVLARVFGVLESVIVGAIALGSLLAPLLIVALGLEGALIAAGMVLPLLALPAWPALSRIDAEVPPRGDEIELLRRAPMFSPLPPAALEGLAEGLRRVSVGAGEEVVRQGEPGDLFYLIRAGEVEVFEDGRLARREGPGEHFGEIALLRDVPRTATVVARTDLELLALDRDAFLEAVTGHSLSGEAAEAIVATRLGSTRRSVS